MMTRELDVKSDGYLYASGTDPKAKKIEPEEELRCYLFGITYQCGDAQHFSQHYQLLLPSKAQQVLRDVVDMGLFLTYPEGRIEYFPKVVGAVAVPGHPFEKAINMPTIVI